VHDFYRRFIRRDADEKHYVMVGRIATIGLFLASSALVFVLDTAKDAFDIILQVGAGTGLLYLVRWFWWRVNAWCEVVAMVSSFVISLVLLVLTRNGMAISTHMALILTVAATTICWVITAYVGPQTDQRVLIEFYRKVRPSGPGWTPIRAAAGLSEAEARATADNIPLALLGWVVGSAMIWSALFTVGNFLYGRNSYALLMGAVFVVSGSTLLYVIRQLWTDEGQRITD
jgi:solute:Na+ symporter, SSS family